MDLQESFDYLKSNVYGTDADDTIALGLMLALITDQLKASNLLKMQEMGLIPVDELGEVTETLRKAVGLKPSLCDFTQ